jgi:hypothetical protein
MDFIGRSPVVFDNCYRDSAQVNAAKLRTLLDREAASTREVHCFSTESSFSCAR